MTVEIIPKKPEPKPITFGDILFYVLVFLSVTAVAGYFVLNQLKGNAEKGTKDIEGILATEQTPEIAALEKRILLIRDKINDFAVFQKDHTRSSNVLVFLERISHPNVLFETFSLNRVASSLSLSGTAKSFEALGQQIQLFENEKLINTVTPKEVSITREGDIKFSLELSLNPEIFHQSLEE